MAGTAALDSVSTPRTCSEKNFSLSAAVMLLASDSRKFTSADSKRDSRFSTYSVSATKRFIGNCTNFPSTNLTSFSVRSNFIGSSRLKLGQPVLEGKIKILQVHQLAVLANRVTHNEPVFQDLHPEDGHHQLKGIGLVVRLRRR